MSSKRKRNDGLIEELSKRMKEMQDQMIYLQRERSPSPESESGRERISASSESEDGEVLSGKENDEPLEVLDLSKKDAGTIKSFLSGLINGCHRLGFNLK